MLCINLTEYWTTLDWRTRNRKFRMSSWGRTSHGAKLISFLRMNETCYSTEYGAPDRTSSKKVLDGKRQLIRRLITRPKRLSSLLRLRRLISRLITRLWRLISRLITRLWRLISQLITGPWRLISQLITGPWRLIS